MSWSISFKGTKEQAAVAIAKQCDDAAGIYDGMNNPAEAADVRAAKERALQAIEACDLSQAGIDYGSKKPYNGVNVTGWGSRSACSMTMSVKVEPAVVDE